MSEAILRPAFTRELALRLQQGASINLTAPHGLGRRRTLQDLRTLLPAGLSVLYADMKFRAGDFTATMADLCAQAGLSSKVIQHAGQLIDAQMQKPTLLILHNFDLLRNEPHDPLFDSALLPYLSEFSVHSHLALLTVCEAVYADWSLPCEQVVLPPQE